MAYVDIRIIIRIRRKPRYHIRIRIREKISVFVSVSELSENYPIRKDPRVLVHNCLCWVRAPLSLNHRAAHIIVDEPAPALDDEEDYMTRNGTIGSVLIATVAFAAAFTVPGGFIADDRPHAGTAILASRFAFRAFVVTDTMAFLCSIVATSFLIYGSAKEIPRGHRWWYSLLASGLVPWGAQFLIGTFALGFHLVLGSANRGLVIFVYMVSSAAVLFCFPGIWGPFCLGLWKTIWRRAGWRGLINIHDRPSSLLEFLESLFTGPLMDIRRTLFPVLISVTFVVAIALDIVMPRQ
uniref:PGG domain-containing protein n=1 Tax=Oryza sativa subsp. japonica TaxID=39947 RepID=Q69IP3_ORYSJ|nr:hypothetical protein [Oryza sativa Japonica Group]